MLNSTPVKSAILLSVATVASCNFTACLSVLTNKERY